MIKNFFRKYKWKLLLTFVVSFAFLLYNDNYISNQTEEQIIKTTSDLVKTEYAVLLGTPQHLPNGEVNNYYKNRISTTAELYKKNKIDKIIISADTLNKYGENEVNLIQNDLIQIGISESDLILDNFGNSTWNSIVNAKKIISQKEVVIISQEFHLERALYIANSKGLNAIGFSAKGGMSNRLWIREIFARVKMQFDLIVD